MAAIRKLVFDDKLAEDLDMNLLETGRSPKSPKKQKKKRKLTKPRRPDPWDDDWYDPADDLASGFKQWILRVRVSSAKPL